MARSRNLPVVVQTGRELVSLAKAAEETKAAKFRRLANIRAGDALLALDRLGNLANPAYEYTDTQIDHLNTVLTTGLKQAITKLRLRTKKVHQPRSIL